MNIYRIRDFLQKWFLSRGVSQCPEFPAALTHGWQHPDFLLAMLQNEPVSFCSFQIISEKSFCNIQPTNNSPGLIWLVKPFSARLYDDLADFFAELQLELYTEKTRQRFFLEAVSNCKSDFLDRGCLQRILFNGVEVGECRIFSEILMEKLHSPAAVITMNIGLLLKCCSADKVNKEPEWIKNYKLGQFAAFAAFSASGLEHEFSTDQLQKSILEIKQKPQASVFEKINSLIFLYNRARANFAGCQKLKQLFCQTIKELNSLLVHIDESEKSERKDAKES